MFRFAQHDKSDILPNTLHSYANYKYVVNSDARFLGQDFLPPLFRNSIFSLYPNTNYKYVVNLFIAALPVFDGFFKNFFLLFHGQVSV